MNAVSPLSLAQSATLKHKLASQQSRINERLQAAERVSPSRERRSQARAHGYRGPLTRSELAKAVK